MQQSRALISGKTPNRKQPIVPIRRIEADIREAYRCLDKGNVAGFVEIHRRVGVTPPRSIICDWAREALWRGELDIALDALNLVGASAQREDLDACVRAASDRNDLDTALRATQMARAVT